ncbi:MAG: NUDIX domain-containing protein [Ruminiclostridium sp.]|nr:NUDIX domain-containing protein [Ruminiclostridium sp.]
MHKIFGIKEDAEYIDREGAYLIPCRNNQIGVISTPKGYFFIGGGLENGENHSDCIKRECLEETGRLSYIEDKLCSAETYTIHPTIGYFHPIQTYYFGQLLDKVSIPTEKDHILCWVEYEELKGNMFVEMQNWALEQLSVRLWKE